MKLELTLSVPEPRVLRTESIPFELTLRNAGESPVQLPQLGANNSALAMRLSDPEGEVLSESTWSDCLRRLQRQKIDENEALVERLDPGATDFLRRDLLRLREPIDPGRYKLTAVLRHEGAETVSNGVDLEVSRSRPSRLAMGSDGDSIGTKHLAMVWADQFEGRPWIVQAMSFGIDHLLLHHVERVCSLEESPGPGQLAVSTGLGPRGDHHATLVHIAGKELRWQRVGATRTEQVGSLDLAAAGARFLCPPLRRGTTTWALLTGAAGAEVSYVALEDDGSSERTDLSGIGASGRHALVAKPDEKPLVLQGRSEGDGSVVVAQDPAGGETREVFRARTPLLALATTHGPKSAPWLAVAVQDDEAERQLTWVIPEMDPKSQRQGPRFERADMAGWQLGVDTFGGVHSLVTDSGGGARYFGPDGKERDVPGLQERPGTLRLVIGRNGRVFAGCSDPESGVQLLPLAVPPAGI